MGEFAQAQSSDGRARSSKSAISIRGRDGPCFANCASTTVSGLEGLLFVTRIWLRVPDVSDDDDKAPRDDEEGPEESKVGGGEESK